MKSLLHSSLFVLCLLISSLGMSQTGVGTLKGKVIDKQTGEPLPFANVVVLAGETQVGGGATNFDGEFNIKPITPGSYNVKCAFVGYNPVIISGVQIKGDKITFQDLYLESGVNLNEVVVIEYVKPLIDKDGGASGGTVTRADIDKMAARTAQSVASTIGGISTAGQAEGAISVRGARSENTYIYIDGIKVRGGNNLPKSAIEEVSVITGGIPANYGDATGGIISITTRGASSEWFGGIDLLSSGVKLGDNIVGLDAYGQTQLEGFLSGPIMFNKNEAGEKTDPLLGFFLSGNFRKFEDRRPSSVGHYYLKDEQQADLEATPTQLVFNNDGTIGQRQRAEDFTLNDLVNEKAARNSDELAASLTAKFDLNLSKTSFFSLGGSADFRDTKDFLANGYTQTRSLNDVGGLNRTNSLYNFDNNPNTERFTWRGFARYTQRFNSDEDSKLKNAFYSLSVDYTKDYRTIQDDRHKDNFFNYGHVAQFGRDNQFTFSQVDGETVQDGISEEFTSFTPGTANPILTNAAQQYFDALEASNTTIRLENLQTSVFNGEILARPYDLWVNAGTPANYYSKRNNSQFRLTTSGSADVGDHALSLGMEYEQRVDRGFDLAPLALWERARLLTNSHINPISNQILYDGYYAPTGDYVTIFQPQINYDSQSLFDMNLRRGLGLDPEGDDFPIGDPQAYLDWVNQNNININELDPSLLSLDMFSATDLLAGGSNVVDYYGYDHTGNIVNGNPSIEDYFTQVGTNGQLTKAIGAFRPVYLAGYIMDKFAFDDIIFNVGVRIDRFDANQSVLKDEYIVGDFYTAGNIPSNAPFDILQQINGRPANIGSDYVVYVDNIEEPGQVKGYRDGDDWYDANGTFLSDPQQLNIGVASYPYLTKRSDYAPVSGLDAGAFKDYTPSINVMPRVAFSFPISDEAVFFAHYDVLTQRPESGVRLDLISYQFIQSQSGVINNPNLQPTKTIDYELGFQQVLTKSSSLKISAFYRDMRDMIQSRQLAGAWPETYTSYRNIDFGTVKGLTIAFDLRRTGNARINANYTLQFAGGTGSNATSGLGLANTGLPNLQNVSPLDFDQRHAINLTLDYRYGDGKDYNGPVWFGKQVFANTGLNLIANLGSGTPYSNTKIATPIVNARNSGGLDGTLNGARLNGLFTMNAQLDKNITLKFKKEEGGKEKTANMNIYLLVNNILNTVNVVSVYPFTGSAEDDGFLATESARLIYENVDNGNPQTYQDLYTIRLSSPYNYGLARTIQLGVKLDF
jgi:hypothetical protein